MLQASVWLGRDYVVKWADTAIAAAEKLGEAFHPGAEFAGALKACKESAPEADNALWVAIRSNGGNEMKATAFLALMRRVSKGRGEELLVQMPEQGAQHVVAIAKRLLAEKQ